MLKEFDEDAKLLSHYTSLMVDYLHFTFAEVVQFLVPPSLILNIKKFFKKSL